MLETPYSAFGALLYDPDAPEGKIVAAGFPKAIDEANIFLDEATKLIPDKAGEISELKDRFQLIAVKAKRPIEIGQAVPPLLIGKNIKPGELDQFAHGAVLLTDVDMQTRTLTSEITEFDARLIAESAQATADLRAQLSGATTLMVDLAAPRVDRQFQVRSDEAHGTARDERRPQAA